MSSVSHTYFPVSLLVCLRTNMQIYACTHCCSRVHAMTTSFSPLSPSRITSTSLLFSPAQFAALGSIRRNGSACKAANLPREVMGQSTEAQRCSQRQPLELRPRHLGRVLLNYAQSGLRFRHCPYRTVRIDPPPLETLSAAAPSVGHLGSGGTLASQPAGTTPGHGRG